MLKNDIKKLLPSWILNSSTYSVSITDLEGKYIFINEVFYDRFSFVTKDLLGKSFEITMHQDDVEKAIQASQECIKHPDRHVKLYIRKPDIENNTFYWTHWEFSLFHDAEQKPIGILCLGHDVTVERMAQKQLKDSESKLSAILDSTIHSNVFLSPDLKVIYFNRVASEGISKYFNREIKIGDDYLQYVLIEHRTAFLKDFNTALVGQVTKIEWRASFDEDACFETTFFPVYNDQNEILGVAFNTENVSNKKKAELKIKEQNKRLLDIAWSQSHQIRGPLSSIMSIVNLVNSQVDIDSKLEAIQYLDEATKKLDEVIRDIVEKTNLEEKF